MNGLKLSIVIDFQHEGSLEMTVDSIFSSGLKNETEVIVLDQILSKESKEEFDNAAHKYTSNSIKYVKAEHNIPVHLNELIPDLSGAYIAIISSGSVYENGSLEAAAEQLSSSSIPAVSLCPQFINANHEPKPYMIAPLLSDTYNVLEAPDSMQFLLKCYVFQKSVFETVTFEENARFEYAHFFLIDYFVKYHSYTFLADHKLSYYTGEEDDHSTNFYQYQKDWYTSCIQNELIPFKTSHTYSTYEEETFVSCCILYLLYVRYHNNLNDRNKNILKNEKLEAFFDASSQLLSLLNERIIMQRIKIGTTYITRSLRIFFLQLKLSYENRSFKVTDNGVEFELSMNLEKFLLPASNQFDASCIIGRINNESVFVQAMNYRKGHIEIDAFTSLSDFLKPEQIHIFAEIDGKQRIQIVPTKVYPLQKMFGITYNHKFPFHISIPLDFDKNKQEINFYLEVNGRKVPLSFKFPKTGSRLSNKTMNHGYWQYKKGRILYTFNRTLISLKQNAFRRSIRELKLFGEIWQNAISKKSALYSIAIRMAYHIVHCFTKNKRIWITNDKIYKAGDNGEYIYHYIHDNVKDVKIYYIIGKNAPNYKELKRKGENLLVHESFKCRLVSLLAEVMLDTHTTVLSYCGIPTGQQPFLRDLFHAEIICIQHGLTIQQIAQYQNRLFDNINYYCCASQYEVNNILQPIYDYKPEDIALVGLARYDGLKNNDQKQILITPTWRRDIVNNGYAFRRKTHNEHFKETEYYRIYNSLINDRELIDCAKECGYKIIYLLHPAMSSQSVDYDRNEYVQIMEAAGDMSYEKILTESSLMVTDYSGVQFDFAYMRKPIVYYHPDSLPPHYEEGGGLIYETMGFGPICKNHKQIVDALCRSMRNQCKNDPMYIDRANKFFAYDDFNNCKRIYEATEKFMESIREE